MSASDSPKSRYVGRFAPSPSGPLHFGSLLAAVASYLDAKSNEGLWLVRMEDLDPPREPVGTADLILQQLHDFSMQWDSDVLYQSDRLGIYQEILEQLQKEELCFPCDCTRGQIKLMANAYDGSCRRKKDLPKQEYALRVKVEDITIDINDLIQGNYSQNLATDVGDFVILRKDGLFAYQLAVVADDEYQNISHVIRGMDLLDSTPRQVFLQQKLNYRQLQYGHIPIVINDSGQKLSKQHFAAPINSSEACTLLVKALGYLGQKPDKELLLETPEKILQWGSENWDIQAVPKLATIPEDMTTW